MADDSNLQEFLEAVKAQNDLVAESTRSGEASTKEPCFVVAIGASAGGEGHLEHIFNTTLDEELVTVNAEPQGKVENPEQGNSDMENLFASSGIAIVFLDRDLIIKSFSPAMAAIFNLFPADIGRPFRHLAGSIDWPDLSGDVQTVVEKCAPIEREVRSLSDWRCFIMRILPYRTSDERIDGVVVTLTDITGRKGAKDAIVKAKEEWERTFDSMPDLIAILDDRHRIVRVNRAMAERLGVSPEDCVGRNCYQSVHGTDKPPGFCPHVLTLADGREHLAELHGDNLGGDFLVTTTPLLDEKGRSIGSVHVARDITERKRMEDALRVSEERFRTLLVNIPGAAYRCEIEAPWRISFLSEGVEAITGYPASEFMQPEGLTWGDVVLPEDMAGVEDAVNKGVANRAPYEMEYRIRHADGGIIWVFEQARAVYDAEGRPQFLDGVIVNVSAHKLAEEALEAARLAALQEKSRLEAVMETLPVGVAIVDAMGGNIRSNRAYEHVWGGPHPLPGTVDDYTAYKAWWIDTGQPLQPEEWASARAAQKDETVTGQLLRIERFDGSHGYIHNSAAPIHDADGRITGSAVVVMDITEQMETKESLRLAKEAAEEANSAKSLFLANMSHELRTPMTGVLGMLEIAGSGPLDEKQREAIDIARMSGHSLLRIINDILDFTRIETGKLAIDEKPFDLADCVAGVIDILIPEARRKGLDLFRSIEESLPQTFAGDKLRLQQVLTNLVGNAVKFTERGKVEVTVRPGRETPEGKREIIFTVSDTGIGIPADKKEMIFHSFSQADASHSRSYGGTGLGLSISREIVKRMGGSIDCESTVGKGSSFSFTIPFLEAGPESASTAEPKSTAPLEAAVPLISGGGRARLLIAEDDEVTRKVLGFMLQNCGFEFQFAMDGRQVVEMWEQGEYDLVVMDGQMPVMDGFAATAAIRERERERGGHIPIVAMTAHALKSDEERCLACGMDAYVSKPIDFKKCVEVIRGLIDQCDRGK